MESESKRRQFSIQKTYSIENGYRGRRRSLIEDARFETMLHKEEIPSMELLDDIEDSPFAVTEAKEHVLEDMESQVINISAVFQCEGKMGMIGDMVKSLAANNITITHLETRPPPPSSQTGHRFDVLIRCQCSKPAFQQATNALSAKTALKIREISVYSEKEEVPDVWFPTSIYDLDKCSHIITRFEPELDSRHPGFNDKAYQLRRKEIAEIAFRHRHGDPVPKVDYNVDELATWATVYNELRDLYPKYACKRYVDILATLEKECDFGPHAIPQMEDLTKFLRSKTGFQLRPAAGLLTARDFLASLAFRVFQCTQYVRHPSRPHHTPEPDCVHELLGHVPLLADPTFAQFSQELGLASLAATDEEMEKLATLYWFTIEFGLCKEGDEIRAYGAGLLSAFGELQHALSDVPQREPFDPEKTAITAYQDENYQPLYFVSDSIEDAMNKLRQFTKTMKRPFSVAYDPYTQSIIKLDKIDRFQSVIDQLHAEVSTLKHGIEQMKK